MSCAKCKTTSTKSCGGCGTRFCSQECHQSRELHAPSCAGRVRIVPTQSLGQNEFTENRRRLMAYIPNLQSSRFRQSIEEEVVDLNRLKEHYGSEAERQLVDLQYQDVYDLVKRAWDVFLDLVKADNTSGFYLDSSAFPGGGVGLFSKGFVTPLDTLEYAGKSLGSDALLARRDYIRSRGLPFFLIYGEDGGVDGSSGPLSYAVYANSSSEIANAELQYDSDRIWIRPNFNIPPNTEIVVDYSDSFAGYTENSFIPNYLHLLIQIYGGGRFSGFPLFQKFDYFPE